jgi:hypothetical protein
MVSALPAMSLNSAAGLRERIRVAAQGRVSQKVKYTRIGQSGDTYVQR